MDKQHDEQMMQQLREDLNRNQQQVAHAKEKVARLQLAAERDS